MNLLHDQPDHQPPQQAAADTEKSLPELQCHRNSLVAAVLTARDACEKANAHVELNPHLAEEAQLRLSATVQALEDLDEQLVRRNQQTHPGSPCSAP